MSFKMFSVFIGVAIFSSWTHAFPILLEWQNKPVIAFENKTQAALKNNSELKAPFALATAHRDEAVIVFNRQESVRIYENSNLQITDLNVETGTVADIYFYSGKIRFFNNPKLAVLEWPTVILKTPFFDLKTPSAESDFFVELDMKKPQVIVRVVKGELDFSFFNYEKKAQLKAGEQIIFVGELEDEKTALKYDYLLNGKKVPRGKMGEVKFFNHIQYLEEEERARLAEIERKKNVEMKRLEKIRKKKAYEATFLCKKPFGRKDQCAWRLESKKCYRRRCNVSGQWGDLTERPLSSRCKPEFTVGSCDY